MKALAFALATLALACAQQEASNPAPAPAPNNPPSPARYIPPIAPVYVAPANTAATSATPPLSGGTTPAGADAGAPTKEEVTIPDKLTVTPPDAFKDGQKVDMFVRANARECFKLALRQDPKADGRIAVKIVIDAKGEVSAATASLDGTLPVSLGACVEKKSKPAFFKAPTTAPVTVVVPMVLTLKRK